MISESEGKLKKTNASLEDNVKELQKMLDNVNDQLQDKDKVCKQEKETLLLEINALENKLSSTSAELLNVVSENSEMKVMLNSSKGKRVKK